MEAQTRIAALESVGSVLKDTPLTVLTQSTETKDKIADVEIQSRRNGLRFYGVPEGKEGRLTADFVSELVKYHLDLPVDVEHIEQRSQSQPHPHP